MLSFFRLILCGLIIFFVSGMFYKNLDWFNLQISILIDNFEMPNLANVMESITKETVDGTNIDGFKRILRYTAHEEEDLITGAVISDPNNLSQITAKSYIIKNLKTGHIVDSKKADSRMPIASLTKLVTAVMARKLIPPNSKIKISKAVMDTYGNTAEFKYGEAFSAEDLEYPLLMVSSNDAAEALARSYGRKKFLDAMNNFVQSIGAYRTYFADPSGLSEDNASSATDMAIILDWIRQNDPEILHYTEIKSKTIGDHTWVNPAHFLNWSNYAGGKNGYTPEANRTGAAIFTFGKDHEPYALVILGSSSRDTDFVKLLSLISS